MKGRNAGLRVFAGGSGLGGWIAALSVVTLPMLVSGCLDLPTVSNEPARLDVTVVAPSTLAVRDSAVVRTVVTDESGNRVIGLDLELGVASGRGGVSLQNFPGDSALVFGRAYGVDVPIVAFLEDQDLIELRSDTALTTAGYADARVFFRDAVGRELPDEVTLTTRQFYELNVGVVTSWGEQMVAREVIWDWTPEGDPGQFSFASSRTGLSSIEPGLGGAGTLVVSHRTCITLCLDSIRIVVAPVPFQIGLTEDREAELNRWEPLTLARSLGDTIQFDAQVLDSAGFSLGPATATWSLVNPADTSVVRVLDANAPAFQAVGNGQVLVRAVGNGLESVLLLEVQQLAFDDELDAPRRTFVVGQEDTLRVRLFDGQGNEVPQDQQLSIWSQVDVRDLLVDFIGPNTERELVVRAVAPGRQLLEVGYVGCRYITSDRRVRCGDLEGSVFGVSVIPEPDSVNIVFQDDSPGDGYIVRGIGQAVDRAFVNTFIPARVENGELVEAEVRREVPRWSVADTSVLVIRPDGTVDTRAPGQTQVVGGMGASADTATVTVQSN